MSTSPTVLYLVAKGRSGSNILAHALGQFPGWINTGELYHLWRWGLQDGALCGCGTPVPACPLWSAVTEQLDLGRSWEDVARLQDDALSWAAIPRALVGRRRSTLREYLEVRRRLYRAIQEVSGASVVVDASKWPWDPAVTGELDFPVHALHLVRDPRAVAFSWQRHKTWGDHEEDATPMPRFGAAYSALSWLARSAVTEIVRRISSPVSWQTVRYEDFVDTPAAVLQLIAERVGHDVAPSMTGPRSMAMGPTHSIGGNVSKFSQGTVELRRDDEWRRAMATRDRWTGTLMASPLLGRYGYPYRVG